ncbi:LrgB family protein [Maritimibacter sp. DP07]|jgi:predicted murein hydrolase (TIGR00659 family)|uniref:LrgB family protein n=1 Tax=Maritimibacter harenae TaxID=2606218 RepID=A0A845M3W1_9RHOB|nr:LrgB family protein [Maritimibacter harenae]MZR14715.1 LrgB family protein [Maritimibacter harenae]
MTDVAEIWSYLSARPLLWLTCTVVAYVLADGISARLNRHPLANPVLISVLLIAPLLSISQTPYATYFDGAQFIHFLLGPATVALAVPLHANLATIRRSALPLLAALFAGSLAAAGSAILIAMAFGLPEQVIVSVSPKSTTAPVALGISEALGGSPTLTAVLVILTGIVGAVVVTPLMNLLRINDWRARGFAVGVAAHGIGTARAFQVNETAGAFAGIGLALNAVLTSILAPILVALLL